MHLAELTQSGHRRPVPPHLPWPLRAWLPEYPAAARRLVARLVGGNGGTPAQAGVCADSRSLRERLGLLGGVSRAVLLAEQADSPHPASPHQLRDLPRRRGRMDSIVSMTLLGEACFSRGAGRGGGQRPSPVFRRSHRRLPWSSRSSRRPANRFSGELQSRSPPEDIPLPAPDGFPEGNTGSSTCFYKIIASRC